MVKNEFCTPEFLLSQGFSLTILKRFWSKVDRNGPVPAHRPELGPCWVWTASTHHWGYGLLGRGDRPSRMLLAHRVSWIIHFGPIPDDRPFVLHHCDNPPCVNPAHLWLGTGVDNNRDMAEKRRSTWGERNARHKLTPAEVGEIRATCGMTQQALGAAYGVDQSTVSLILAAKTWTTRPFARR